MADTHSKRLQGARRAHRERAGPVLAGGVGQRWESQLPAMLGQSEVLRDRRGRLGRVSVAERDCAGGKGSI